MVLRRLLSTSSLTYWIGHPKKIEKLTFRALVIKLAQKEG